MSEVHHDASTHQHDSFPAKWFGLGLVGAGVFVGLSGLVIWALLVTIWKPPGTGVPSLGEASAPTAKSAMAGRAELDRLIHRERRRLNSYGWIDRKNGIVHIPIDEAIRRMVRGGEGGMSSPGAAPASSGGGGS